MSKMPCVFWINNKMDFSISLSNGEDFLSFGFSPVYPSHPMKTCLFDSHNNTIQNCNGEE
jgi:hypothetical protein